MDKELQDLIAGNYIKLEEQNKNLQKTILKLSEELENTKNELKALQEVCNIVYR